MKPAVAVDTESMTQSAERRLRERVRALEGRVDATAESERLELTAALARLTEGTWGRCESCGDAIGRDRLRALPEARTCHRCQR